MAAHPRAFENFFLVLRVNDRAEDGPSSWLKVQLPLTVPSLTVGPPSSALNVKLRKITLVKEFLNTDHTLPAPPPTCQGNYVNMTYKDSSFKNSYPRVPSPGGAFIIENPTNRK